MTRIIIQHLALFLSPTILYAAYFAYRRRRAQTMGADVPGWEEGPWFWLLLGGGLLVLASLAALAIYGGADPQAIYEPATLQDGKVMPGRLSD